MSPEHYIQRLLELSGKKLALLQDMALLTMAQADAINEEGLEALDRLINEKQAKLDEMDKLDEQYAVYFQRMKSELKINSLEELKNPNIQGLKELKTVTAQIVSTIKEISQVDMKNNDNAKKLLDVLGNEVRKLNMGKKITNAYHPGPAVNPPSYFLDKKK